MRHKPVAAVLALMTSLPACADNGIALADENARINYSLGFQLGGDLQRQHVEVRRDALLRGIEDAASGSEPAMSRDQMRSTLIELKRKVVALQREERGAELKRNLEAGEAFLTANAGKQGVVVTSSGLQYRIIRPGTGSQPQDNDMVTVHYRGTLIDGTEFDSSYRRDKPAEFRVDRVLAGWQEALPMMKQGAKWQLFIPSTLAYGEHGAGRIPANSALIFDVELLSIDSRENTQ